MAEHPRRTALNTVKSLLDGQTSAGGSIYVQMIDPLPAGTTRALLVDPVDETALGDEATLEGNAPRLMNVAIKVVATDAALLDELTLEVETAMAAGINPSAPLHRGLSGTQFGAAPDGERPYYVAVLTYQVVYVIGESFDATF